MSLATDRKVELNSQELETVLSSAMKKIGGKDENSICRYLPGKSGGYIHHFTFRKLKKNEPDQLSELLKRYILNADSPIEMNPKRRAARGSRKRKDAYLVPKTEFDQILQIARSAGHSDLIRKLMRPRDLKTAQKELVAAVKRGIIDHELWNSFVEAATQSQAPKA
jgi:hypothetical protein